MKILQANNYYDVFFGDGWYGHSRYRKIRTPEGNKLIHVSGIQLNTFQKRRLLKEVL